MSTSPVGRFAHADEATPPESSASSRVGAPSTPADTVVRSRLDRVLASDHQVILVTAPAGYGKSTLVASWLERNPGVRSAWVSLDDLDRNPLEFWSNVVSSIAACVPDADEAHRILIETGGSTDGGRHLAALTRTLLDDGGPLLLVVDDLDIVGDSGVGAELTTLVERCAGVLRLIAIGRSDPPLPSARWFAERRCTEIRLEDLAFRIDEAAEILHQFELPSMSPSDLERLNDRVEGWAVGLLLGGLALTGRPDLATRLDDVIRTDRHLTDYLVQEVLDRLPDELRQLALDLAVPPYFDAEIAVEISGRSDAPQLLRGLLRRSPFVVTTSVPPRHRFHHLIRTLLVAELRWRDPERCERLHRLAAEAMQQRGQTSAAVSLLRTIGDMELAFDLVVPPSLRVNDTGRLRELTGWLAALGEVSPPDAPRALHYATALVLVGRPADAVTWTERALDLDGADTPGFSTAHAAMSLVALAAAGQCGTALTHLTPIESVGHDVAASPHIDSRISAQVVRLSLEVGDLERAERWLPLVARHPDPPVAQVLSRALHAWLLLRRGNVPSAASAARAACTHADRLGLRPHLAWFDALAALASTQLLSLRLDEARETMEHLAADIDALWIPFNVLRWWPLSLSERALSDGWPAALDLARSWDVDEFPNRGGDLAVRRDELVARALLGCGRADEAGGLIARLGPGRRRELLEARLDLVRGRLDRVESLLVGHDSWDGDSWDGPHRLEALLLLAQARSGTSATTTMRTALELGRTGGMLAPFVLEGRRCRQLMHDLPIRTLHPDLASRLAAVDLSERPTRSVRTVEPLTRKEQEVLAHLPSHGTYQAIGGQLYLSVNTVKTYVSAIFRKLGVSSRSEAVAVAREVGLLDD